MSLRRSVPYLLVATLLRLVVCQTPPPQQRPGGVNMACFNALGLHRHLARPDSRRVVNIQEQRSDFEYVMLSRHHIIPYATMRDFYNNLLRRDQAAFTRMFNDVIYPAANQAGVLLTLGALDYEEYRLPELQQLTDTYLRLSTVSQVQLLQEVYVWLPFNIYIGPRPDDREDDDRANVFDETARTIVGTVQTDRLMSLYNLISSYNSNGNAVSASAIVETMADLVHLQQMPYDFDPSQWRVRRNVDEYRFRVATDAVRNDQNTYRELRADDYCNTDGQAAYDRYLERDELRRRRRQQVIEPNTNPTNCFLLEANNDAFCINTLNRIRESVENGTIELKTSISEGSTTVNYDQPLDPNPSLTPSGWFLHIITFGLWP